MFSRRFLVSIFLVFFLLGYINSERIRYDNYEVYRVSASNILGLDKLKILESSSDAIVFLDDVHALNRDMKVLVAPHKVREFRNILNSTEFAYDLVENNFQRVLDEDEADNLRNVDDEDELSNWRQYNTLNVNYNWLITLPRKYPKIVTLIEGGKSYERRSILGVKISYPGKANKPGIFLEAGIHAREWIGPATATYIINQLLISEDEAVKQIAQNYDWYILPHANPDGYAYTHTTDRVWRKTRSPQGTCYGVDPNRNWDEHWNVVGASSDPCSNTFAGPKAFSEIEARTLAKYISSLKGKIQLYISFHSYSQFLLYPYGYQKEEPENFADFKQVAEATLEAISKRYNTKYTSGTIYDTIYPAAGSSVDWAYDNADAKMAFCFELRPGADSTTYDFRLPADQIIPTGEETLDGIVAMVEEVNKLGYFIV